MKAARPLPWLATLLLCAACENGLQNMYDQPKYEPYEPAPLWRDGRSVRRRVPGTIPFDASPDDLADPRDAREVAALLATPVTLALLERGRNRFDIYCAPCHSRVGDGDGYITRRGFPHPPSYHTDRLRAVSDEYIYSVITNGYGVMYS